MGRSFLLSAIGHNRLMLFRLVFGAVIALLITEPAFAVERSFGITSFLRVRVEGPVMIEIVTGGSPSARAVGDRQAIDRLKVENSGDQLLVTIDRSNWTGDTGQSGNARAVLYVTAPQLEGLSVIGAGDVTIDRATGNRFNLIVTGAGRAKVDRIDVDQFTLAINGTGSAKLAGKTKQALIRSQGDGAVDAAAFSADDAEVILNGSGEIRLSAKRSARNVLKGSGRIIVDGNPACTGSSEGSGEVVCGNGAQ